MMRRSTFLFLIIAVFFGVTTYWVKQSVISSEQDLLRAQKEIFQFEESIHILRAEWSHLNEPARLQKLVENHLGGGSLQGSQLASLEKVPSKEKGNRQDRLVTLARAERMP